VPDLVIEAKGLRKVYGTGATETVALDSVTFEVQRGEFVVLLGASGSGKTTLMNQIGALEGPTSGSLKVNGVELGGMDDKERTEYRRSALGFVFQLYNLVPTLTAHENVALIAEITGEHADERADRVLVAVGLGDRANHFPSQLSGGQQQRVAVARGLVKNPPLLLCDEPTGALSVEQGVVILDLLHEATSDGERTVFLVTHNPRIAEMADRVLSLTDGKIVGDRVNADPKTPAQIFG